MNYWNQMFFHYTLWVEADHGDMVIMSRHGDGSTL